MSETKFDSPVTITQTELIQLSGPARTIGLDVIRVNSLQTGHYVSNFKGRGMEFDESRPYQPGDDPRSIDWRVTARSAEAYTKLFREERERPVLIMTDLRSNMHFATKGCFKSVCASRAAALLSWAAHHRGDRVGGIIFGDTGHRELKPRLGRQAALHYLHQLAIHSSWASKDALGDKIIDLPFDESIAMLRRVTYPGSLVIILSDFIGFSRAVQSYMAEISRQNELMLIFIADPIEQTLPPPGRYRLVGDNEELDIDTGIKAARADYSKNFENRSKLLSNFCGRYGIKLLEMQTNDDVVKKLQALLGRKRR